MASPASSLTSSLAGPPTSWLASLGVPSAASPTTLCPSSPSRLETRTRSSSPDSGRRRSGCRMSESSRWLALSPPLSSSLAPSAPWLSMPSPSPSPTAGSCSTPGSSTPTRTFPTSSPTTGTTSRVPLCPSTAPTAPSSTSSTTGSAPPTSFTTLTAPSLTTMLGRPPMLSRRLSPSTTSTTPPPSPRRRGAWPTSALLSRRRGTSGCLRTSKHSEG
mmetsp:Transcript_47917/g.119808  ORF Transcript_47917/g.119808 Transcript_47917/m.119808 type:complete len:217 (+) Transcript_47917:816-1466(+)